MQQIKGGFVLVVIPTQPSLGDIVQPSTNILIRSPISLKQYRLRQEFGKRNHIVQYKAYVLYIPSKINRSTLSANNSDTSDD